MEFQVEELKGKYVTLSPMNVEHHDRLVEAVLDGDIYRSTVTYIPNRDQVKGYIDKAIEARDSGHECPYVIISNETNCVVWSTRYRQIEAAHKRLEIGATFLSASAQRTGINTNAKILLLENAFEKLGFN